MTARLQRLGARVSGVLGPESRIIKALRPEYEWLLGAASVGRGIPWAINGVTFRIDPRCRHRMGANYDVSVASFLKNRVRPGAVCFDVGANVGVYVLQFAHWSGPSGRVVAFEPNPEAREILTRHVRINGLERRVEIVPEAIGLTQGEAIFYRAGADGMSRLGAPNGLIAHLVTPLTVKVTTLDSFIERSGLVPDWLLIDIEGFEIAALQGAAKLIERGRPNLGIVVEMHPNAWGIAGTGRDHAEGLLSSFRLRCLPLTGQHEPLAEHGLVQLAYD